MIRVTVNATFKQLKVDLVKKSWDPRSGEGDKLYWLNGNKYEKLDASSWSSIEAGQAKLWLCFEAFFFLLTSIRLLGDDIHFIISF